MFAARAWRFTASTIQSTPLQPEYLPVDENHPLRPQDPYGLSKLVGEKLCEAASLNDDMQIASLRFSGIYTEEHRGLLMERRKNPIIRGTGALWSYIDVRDAARACRLALEANFSGHQTFNLCAPDTIMDTANCRARRKVSAAGASPCAKPDGRWSGYDIAKAEKILGFRAKLLLHN